MQYHKIKEEATSNCKLPLYFWALREIYDMKSSSPFVRSVQASVYHLSLMQKSLDLDKWSRRVTSVTGRIDSVAIIDLHFIRSTNNKQRTLL